MTIILFLVDTSASMAQRNYMGCSAIDMAKSIVRDILKPRQHDINNRQTDRYMLFSTEEFPGCVKAGWKEGSGIFHEQLKALRPCGKSPLKQALLSALHFINLNRANTGVDYDGHGRLPHLQESVIIVMISDGAGIAELPSDFELRADPKHPTPGTEDTEEAFRWDQRIYSVVLRMSARSPAEPRIAAAAAVTAEPGVIQRVCEATGGRSFTMTSHQQQPMIIDTLMQMSASLRSDGPESSDESNNFFPFLALPRELKSHVFSFLGAKDRMKARVCKELNAIEAASKYYVERLKIEVYKEVISDRPDDSNTIILCEDKSDSIDGIRRIAQNASIGHLDIEFAYSRELHREVYDLIKEFKADKLTVFMSPWTVYELIRISFLVNIPITCKYVSMYVSSYICPVHLREVYQSMMGGSTNLRKFEITADTEHFSEFLSLIGISIDDGVIRSHKDIEAYKSESQDEGFYDYYLFEGNIEISQRCDSLFMKLTLHETRESLEEAKGKLVNHKVDVIRVPHL